ncbi:HNH endonuclease signature motif containing protein [Streptomyces sp. NPDC054834]
MRIRVGAFYYVFWDGRQYNGGDLLDVPEPVALRYFRLGHAAPVDGDWRGVIPSLSAPRKPKRSPAAVCPCEPGDKPNSLRRSTYQRCPVDGCQCLTWRGKCRAHTRTSTVTGREYGTGHRNVSADLRRKWEKVRRAYLAANPYCECEECMRLPALLRPDAIEVDHKDGLGLLGPKAFEWDNLQSMTKSHHARKTAGESFGH